MEKYEEQRSCIFVEFAEFFELIVAKSDEKSAKRSRQGSPPNYERLRLIQVEHMQSRSARIRQTLTCTTENSTERVDDHTRYI